MVIDFLYDYYPVDTIDLKRFLHYGKCSASTQEACHWVFQEWTYHSYSWLQTTLWVSFHLYEEFQKRFLIHLRFNKTRFCCLLTFHQESQICLIFENHLIWCNMCCSQSFEKVMKSLFKQEFLNELQRQLLKAFWC